MIVHPVTDPVVTECVTGFLILKPNYNMTVIIRLISKLRCQGTGYS